MEREKRIKELINSIKRLDSHKLEDEKTGVSCIAVATDDFAIKLAIVKTEKPRVYEIIQFEKIDDILFKERIVKSVKIYGRGNAADLVYRVLDREVRL